MQYFDLNIRPNKNEEYEVNMLISQLIINLIITHPFLNVLPKLDYDEKTKILKITDKHALVQLDNFMFNHEMNADFIKQKANLYTPIPELELIQCIANLVAQDITIKMTCNNLEATLIIVNKQGNNQQVASLAWAWQVKPQTINGVIFEITSITKEEYEKVLHSFLGYQSWKSNFHTKNGNLLISYANDKEGAIYINGALCQFLPNQIVPFMFSYNLIYSWEWLSEIEINPLIIFDKIVAILKDLDEKDKQVVYKLIFDQFNNKKWNEPQSASIRKFVIKYFSHLNPNKYLIRKKDELDVALTFANDKKKILIPTLNNQEYEDLVVDHVKTLEMVFNHYFLKNCHFVKESELTGIERDNLMLLNEFFDFLMEKYGSWKQFFLKHHLVHLPLQVVTCQYNHSMIDENTKQVILSEPYLSRLYFLWELFKRNLYQLLDYLQLNANEFEFNLDDEFFQFIADKINQAKNN